MLKNQTLKKLKKVKLTTKVLATKNMFLKILKSIMLFLKKTIAAKAK